MKSTPHDPALSSPRAAIVRLDPHQLPLLLDRVRAAPGWHELNALERGRRFAHADGTLTLIDHSILIEPGPGGLGLALLAAASLVADGFGDALLRHGQLVEVPS